MKKSGERRLGLVRKLLYGLLSTVMFFVLLELVLSAIDFRKVIDDDDPLVGFSQNVPLFEEVRGADGSTLVQTRMSKLVWFNGQQFTKQKSKDTCRIVCLGGSTTYGRPYSDSTSFSGWLRKLLPIVEADKNWQVINAGGVSYASYRVANVMQEMLAYEPDVFIVYTGHNEFLEDRTYAGLKQRAGIINDLQALVVGTRTYALVDRLVPVAWHETEQEERELLPAEVDERLNHTIGPSDYQRDPEWSSSVVEHYRLNLERMVRMARDADVEIIFVTPASNEKDCAPFKALPGETDLAANPAAGQPAAAMRPSEILKKAIELEQDGQLLAAVDSLRKAVEIDPLHAGMQYQLGRLLSASGDFEAAGVVFQEAIDQDICPLRATTAILSTLKDVCISLDVPCVDFQSRLRQKAQVELGHDVLGDEFFLDHVHPNMDLHFELAKWIIELLQREGMVAQKDLRASELELAFESCREQVLASLDDYQHGVALRNLAKVLHWSGKFELAANRASDALELLGNDAESRFVLADCLKNSGELERARIQFEMLVEDDPGYGRAYVPFGQLLIALGEPERGLGFLLDAVIFDPENANAHAQVGKYYLQQGEWQLAAAALLEAARLNPEDRQTRRLLDMCRQALGIAGYPIME